MSTLQTGRRRALGAMMMVLTMSAMLVSPFGSAANPTVDIAGVPLYSGRGNVHPNLLLSLSVEFPTVGIAYRGDGGTYNRTTEYVGYFNPAKCYLYNGSDHDTSDTGYFYISKNADATTHECGGGAFSGNFMNWAASSAIDMLRLALTGGDRVIDTRTTTVLQRAVLMDSPVENFYANGSYFPRRTVKKGGNVSAPNQVTPFNVTTLYVVSCRNRILFSDSSSGMPRSSSDYATVSKYCTDGYNKDKGSPADKKLGDYLARVLVCDATEGPSRTDLCRKYGNNYKPVGEIQNKAGSLRLAAMGYLLDNDQARYGGVLRAPMKYVGSKKIDTTTFSEVVNDRLEWNPDTGVFYSNPEDPANRSSTTANSGVINYLNKFGRSANYKQYDPVSELYYEGIRYLQGKQPTANAVTGMTEAMKDGFPVIDNWSDPVTASCQNSYILTIADVNTHWDRYIPGNKRTWTDQARPKESADGKTPELDVTTWTKIVGDLESSTRTESNPTPSNPAARSNLAGMENLDTGAGGHGTYYMAGLAYWANTHDIRLDKHTRIKTFAIDVDEGGNGLIDGNTRSLKPRDSQLYLAAKYGGFNDINGDGNPFITFDIDGTTIVKGVNKEWDNGNGVPANYFLAGQPKELIQSIRNIFNNISNISGTISGVSVSSTKLASTDAFAYQPGFNASKWSGSLRKLALSLKDDGSVGISTQAEWDAGVLLTGVGAKAAYPAPDQRKIYTTKLDAANTASAVEFKWATLGDAQRSLLNASPEDGVQDDLGERRVNFLRGARTDELGQANGIFRARERVLGDIVNGNPVYVGAPATNIQGRGYQAFYDARKGRTPAVYIGANDGMLHAFKAGDGKELFAYVPNAVIPSLNQLTSPNYTHHSYVDGPLATGEALVADSWKTVLVSGMGSGAQGVFALDVTDPVTFGAGNVLWEFTDLNDPDMGNIVNAPVIAKFKTGTTNGVATYKYFAVVSSGLNNYKDDGQNRFNADAAGALFLLSLDKSPGEQWRQNVNYFKFRTPSSNADAQNGLGMPALVTDTGGAVLYIYAGDLQGNLWRVDFSDASLAEARVGTKPLFIAKDGNDIRQPITMQPKIVFAPRGGYIVLFGTGKFIENTDAVATADGFKPQSFYAVHDKKGNIVTSLDRGSLVPRTLTKSGGGFAVTGDSFLYGDSGSSSMGWYIDFFDSVHTGERAITNPVLSNGILFFNSLIPGGDPCGSGGGRTYVLDVLTGLVATSGVTGYESQIGMLSSPVVFQAGASVGERNATGRRMVSKKNSIVNFGTNGAAAGGVVPSTTPAGRLSWREILNWQEVRNALKN